MRIPVVLLACAAMMLVSSCGYRLGAAKPAILQNVTKIAIPTFKNKTFEPNIEVLLADTTIKQFQQDGTYEIVPDNRADAILFCTGAGGRYRPAARLGRCSPTCSPPASSR